MRSQSIFSIALLAFASTSYSAPVEVSARGDTVASLLASLPAGHGSDRRDVNADATSLLSALPAGHGSPKRDFESDAAALQALSDSVHQGDSS